MLYHVIPKRSLPKGCRMCHFKFFSYIRIQVQTRHVFKEELKPRESLGCHTGRPKRMCSLRRFSAEGFIIFRSPIVRIIKFAPQTRLSEEL